MDVDALQDMLRRLEQYEEAEEERLREEMIAARVELEVAMRMAEQQPPLYRAHMSALAKSQYIRARGKAEYDRLPFYPPGEGLRRRGRP